MHRHPWHTVCTSSDQHSGLGVKSDQARRCWSSQSGRITLKTVQYYHCLRVGNLRKRALLRTDA